MKQFAIRYILLVCSLIAVAQLAWSGELQHQLRAESALEQVLKRGTLRVGMDVFVPWAMKDKKGQLIGFEIDVAKQLAQDMGVKIQFVPTKWSGIIPALIAGKFDLIIGGMTVTPERNLQINFTRPYYYTGQGLLANKKMTSGWKLDDFNKPGVTLAARLGSTAAVAAKKRFPQAGLRLFDDEPAAVQEVRNGRVQAMVAGQPLPAHSAADAPALLVAYPEQLLREPISMGLNKGDVDTLNFLNNWIEQTRAKGWIDERYAYWFDSTQWKKRVW
ncbi:transporter substrate-binding domain-containing protein [Desulfobulbus rhabdoformis]|uniref:transporter substrate-binding domain-containing protein n=1 Tax=Desulfobulbus rhabdoformis TaxID=34032 RepID=UPI001966B34D|nr:transporter substrate-binding domain-containing protein [Desulfobulbus rhabdoformis]MBM9613981.1 transporter substrate-binding domain-containing protein [Desulfobulbus rhabdoformis]